MLERATSSAEYTAHLFLRSVEHPIRSRRVLDPSFWRYASRQPELPAWWPVYLENIRRNAQASLLPADATPLNALPRYHVREERRPKRSPAAHLRLSQPSQHLRSNARPYTQSAARGQEEQNGHAEHLAEESASEKIVFTPLAAPPSEESRLQARASARGNGLLNGPLSDPAQQLLLTEPSEDTSPDYAGAWTLFAESEYKADSASGILRFLSQSNRSADLKHALTAFQLIPRDSRVSQDYDDAVRSTVKLNNYRQATNLIKEAAQKQMADGLFYFFIAHCVDKTLWNTLAIFWDSMRQANFISDIVRRARPELSRSPNFAGRYAHHFDMIDDLPAKIISLSERLVRCDAVIAAHQRPLTDICKRLAYVAVESAAVMKIVTGEGILLLFNVQKQLDFDSKLHLAALGTLLKTSQRGAKSQLALLIYENFKITYRGALVPRWAFGGLLSICADGRQLPVVYRSILEDFTKMHGRPDDHSFQIATRACAQQGEATALFRIFESWDALGGVKNTLDLNPLVYVFAIVGNVEGARTQFERIRKEFRITPDVVNWTTLLYAHAQSRYPESAFRIMRNMKDAGIRPNDYTYSILMSVAARKGDLDRARELYEEAKNSNIPISSHMIGALVESMLRNGQVAQAETTVLRAAGTSGGASTIRLWNILFRHYAFNDGGDAIADLQKKMSQFNVTPDGMTYAALMTYLVTRRRTSEALKILRQLLYDRNINPNEFHYSILIHGFVLEGNRDMATVIYDEMRNRFPNVSPAARLAMLHLELQRDEASTTALFEALLRESDRPSETVARANPSRGLEFLAESLLDRTPSQITSKVPSPGFGRRTARDGLELMYFQALIQFLQARGEFVMAETLIGRSAELELTSKTSGATSLEHLTLEMQSAIGKQEWSNADRTWDRIFNLATEMVRPLALAEQSQEPYGHKSDTTGQSVADTSSFISSDMHTFDSMIPTVVSPNNLAGDGRMVLSSYKFILSRSLSIYMQGLDYQRRHEAIVSLIEELPQKGFALSNMNWNRIIQVLSKSANPSHRMLAYISFEEHLLPMLPSWPALRRSLSVSVQSESEVEKYMPTYKTRPEILRPTYFTVIHLSAALMRMFRRGLYDEAKEINRRAPGIFKFLQGTPQIRDRISGILLRGRKASGDAPARVRAAPPNLDRSGITGSVLPSSNVSPEFLAKLDDAFMPKDDIRSLLKKNEAPQTVDLQSLSTKERLAYYLEQAAITSRRGKRGGDSSTATYLKDHIGLNQGISDAASSVVRGWISLGEQIGGEITNRPIYLAAQGRLENAQEQKTRIQQEIVNRLDLVYQLRTQKVSSRTVRNPVTGDPPIATVNSETQNSPRSSKRAKALAEILVSEDDPRPLSLRMRPKQLDKVEPASDDRPLRTTSRFKWLAKDKLPAIDTRVFTRKITPKYQYVDKQFPVKFVASRQKKAFTINKEARARRRVEAQEFVKWHRETQIARREKESRLAAEEVRRKQAEKKERDETDEHQQLTTRRRY